MRKLIFISLLLSCGLSAWGQKGNAEAEQLIRENLFRASVNICPYEVYPSVCTPVPKGYKPFYISHYGRHGARSDWAGSYYEQVSKFFDRAHEQGNLTPEGEKAREYVTEVVRRHDGMDGRLTPLGAAEHRGIAGRMYTNYKSVFRSGGSVRAISSVVPRCLVSMAAFTGELLSRQKDLDISWDTGERFMKICATGESKEAREATKVFVDGYKAANPPDTAGFYARILKDPSVFLGKGKGAKMMGRIFGVGSICGSYGMDDFLLRLFSIEDLCVYSQGRSSTYYLNQCNSVDFGDQRMEPVKPLLEDVLSKADEAIAGGNVAVDLRFGHDWQLLAFCSLIGLEGVGERLTPEQSLNVSLIKATPFAGNVQMIFYRNRKGHVLVKFLLNERETRLLTLPGGPYYDWNEFKAVIGN